jgi:hypothetical protein
MPQIELGSKFYLFLHDETGVANNYGDREVHLLISAHGGYMNLFGPLRSAQIRVPRWCRLNFYADHGASLSDPSVGGIAKGQYQVSESYEPQDLITDYELSKYQGSHNSAGETYATIKTAIDINNYNVGLGNQSQTRNFGFYFDVLTVRNRRFRSDPSLSDVFTALDQAGRRYENIHCSFCRSKMFGSSPTQSATAFGTA